MSKTKIAHRVFAMGGAILFSVSVVFSIIIVIIQQINQSHQDAQAQAAQKTAQTCQETSVPASIMPAPSVYKASGPVQSLQTTDLKQGKGPAAKAGDCLQMKYYGTLAQKGTKFDENFTQPQAFQFVLGQGQVIPAWDKGVAGMKVGGERRLIIPSSLAYGAQGQGAIPPNSDLVFDVSLVSISK